MVVNRAEADDPSGSPASVLGFSGSFLPTDSLRSTSRDIPFGLIHEHDRTRRLAAGGNRAGGMRLSVLRSGLMFDLLLDRHSAPQAHTVLSLEGSSMAGSGGVCDQTAHLPQPRPGRRIHSVVRTADLEACDLQVAPGQSHGIDAVTTERTHDARRIVLWPVLRLGRHRFVPGANFWHQNPACATTG